MDNPRGTVGVAPVSPPAVLRPSVRYSCGATLTPAPRGTARRYARSAVSGTPPGTAPQTAAARYSQSVRSPVASLTSPCPEVSRDHAKVVLGTGGPGHPAHLVGPDRGPALCILDERTF